MTEPGFPSRTRWYVQNFTRRSSVLYLFHQLTLDTWLVYGGFKQQYPSFITCECGGALLGAGFTINWPHETILGWQMHTHMVYSGGVNCDCPYQDEFKWLRSET